MRDLLPNLWYHVRTDAPEGAQATSAASLETLAELLPHGSGYDSDWYVSLTRRGITLTTEWHSMTEHGYYSGYWPVYVTLRRSKTDGSLSLGSVRVNQSGERYGLADMIADDMAELCRQLNPAERTVA
jgi:hypothetical protein